MPNAVSMCAQCHTLGVSYIYHFINNHSGYVDRWTFIRHGLLFRGIMSLALLAREGVVQHKVTKDNRLSMLGKDNRHKCQWSTAVQSLQTVVALPGIPSIKYIIHECPPPHRNMAKQGVGRGENKNNVPYLLAEF